MKQTKKHPNFFDILIILLVLLVAVAAYLLSHRNGAQSKEVVTRSCTIELMDLDERMADAVAVGDTVMDNIKNYEIGTVTAVETCPYEAGAVDEASGVTRQVAVPGRIVLLLTVECDTVETEKEIATVSGYTLRTGISVSCSVGELTAGGYILSLER